jgi:type 1 fimbriae regulatory protein FimB/type 1 fimbriae regulatory protein FimE
MIMLAYRHGFRSLEIVNLKWNQINLEAGTIEVQRVKNGDSSLQPLSGDEIRALRKLHRQYPDSPFVFSTERLGPMTTRTYRNIIQQAGIKVFLANEI